MSIVSLKKKDNLKTRSEEVRYHKPKDRKENVYLI